MVKLSDSGLIVFLRSPVEGKVKTRIASQLSNMDALIIYRELMEMTLTLASKSGMSVYIFYDGPSSAIPKQASFNFIAQIPGDLGTRMQHAFEFVLRHHNKAIIIGADCPYITNKDLSETEILLDKFDCVAGPAEDGGYYLLGLKNVNQILFQSITWGTSTVMVETIQKLEEEKMSYVLLRTLQDVDTAEDWYNYKHYNTRQSNLRAPE